MCVETQVKYISKIIENIQGIWQSDSNLLDLRIISWSILRYLYMGKALSSCLVSQHLNNWVEWGNALTTTDTSKPGEPESAAQEETLKESIEEHEKKKLRSKPRKRLRKNQPQNQGNAAYGSLCKGFILINFKFW